MKQVIREARLNAGYSLKQLSDLCGCDYTYLSLVERGIKTPGVNMRNKLISILDLSHEEIRSDYSINK